MVYICNNTGYKIKAWLDIDFAGNAIKKLLGTELLRSTELGRFSGTDLVRSTEWYDLPYNKSEYWGRISWSTATIEIESDPYKGDVINVGISHNGYINIYDGYITICVEFGREHIIKEFPSVTREREKQIILDNENRQREINENRMRQLGDELREENRILQLKLNDLENRYKESIAASSREEATRKTAEMAQATALIIISKTKNATHEDKKAIFNGKRYF